MMYENQFLAAIESWQWTEFPAKRCFWCTELGIAMATLPSRLDLLQILELLFHWNTFALDVGQSLINTILRQKGSNMKQP